MIRRPPRSTLDRSSAASDVYKRQDRTIEEQGDSFWWAGRDFDRIESPYAPFAKIVRGYDPEHRGIRMNNVTATIDGGCGFGGSLVCSVFDQNGGHMESAAV